MNISKTLVIAACFVALNVATHLAARPASAKKQGFEKYSLLQTRNIFDPERRPGLAETPAVTQTPPPSSPSDYAALTGTMITAEKTLAFFSGSRPEFNAVLATSGTIAGAVIKRITPDFVEVERNGKRIVVTVGQTVPLDATSAPASAPTASVSSSAPTTNSSPSPASVDREALIRRMMEKRQQELK